MTLAMVGALSFGLVIGWITYRTLRRREGTAALSDIANIIGVVGGAAVTTLFDDVAVFSAYCIGLALGFFSYFVVGLLIQGRKAGDWMGEK